MKILLVSIIFVLSLVNNSLSNSKIAPCFIENKGQWPDEVRFRTVVDGSVIWITDSAVVSDYYMVETDSLRLGHVIGMTYKGQTGNISYKPQKLMRYYESYFTGSKFIGNVKCYREIIQKNIYNDIDVRYYFDSDKFRYDFIVNPGADPNNIELCFNGQSRLAVEKKSIKIETRFGEVSHSGLMAYTKEDNKDVVCSFIKSVNTLKFRTEEYDIRKTLIIDPVVSCTVLATPGKDKILYAQTDSKGNILFSGSDLEDFFPLTDSVYDEPSQYKLTLVKTSGDMKEIIFSYILPRLNFPRNIAALGNFIIDKDDNIYFFSASNNDSLFVSNNAYQKHLSFNDGKDRDAYIYKLNKDVTKILAATYLGAEGRERNLGFTIDNSNNLVAMYQVASSDFPKTKNAYYKEHSPEGKKKVTLIKLSNDLSKLLCSTYIIKESYIHTLKVLTDRKDNIYICGVFERSDAVIETTPDALLKAPDPKLYEYGFLCRFNSDGSNLEYSTYLDFHPSGIAIDSLSSIYLFGVANINGLGTPGVYQEEFNEEGPYNTNDLYICKLKKDLTDIEFGTYLGGDEMEMYHSEDGVQLGVDADGRIYVLGTTHSEDYPLSDDAMKNFYIFFGGDPNNDMTFTVLNRDASEIIYSTYIGGSSYESAVAQFVDPNGKVIVIGNTSSPDFFTTDGSQAYGYWDDIFIFRYQNDVGVEELPINNQENINIYPNPVSSQATIKFSLDSPAFVKCNILDVFGRKVADVTSTQYPAGENVIPFSKGDLVPGVYFVVLNLSDGRRIEKKFVIR